MLESKYKNDIKRLRKALSTTPNNIPLKIQLGFELIEAGEYKQAKKIAEEIIKSSPNSYDAILLLARTLSNLYKFEEAIQKYGFYLCKAKLTDEEKLNIWKEIRVCCSIAEEGLEIDLKKEKEKSSENNISIDSIIGEAIKETKEEFIEVYSGHFEKSIPVIPFDKLKYNFSNVGGMEDVKEEIKMKIIYPFTKEDLYKEYSRFAGGAILLFGPPGCGKTLIAKAIAGECKLNYISIPASDIWDKYYGNTEKNIKAIFKKARENKPCIIFFDEIESFGGNRLEMSEHYGRVVVSYFLTELDGVISDNEKILIIGATNSPWHLDNALLRPGRFDNIIFIPPPDYYARIEILKMYLENKPKEEINIQELALRTEDFSGADLKKVVELATDIALREAIKKNKIIKLTDEHLQLALQHVKPTTTKWVEIAKRFAEKDALHFSFYENLLRYYDI